MKNVLLIAGALIACALVAWPVALLLNDRPTDHTWAEDATPSPADVAVLHTDSTAVVQHPDWPQAVVAAPVTTTATVAPRLKPMHVIATYSDDRWDPVNSTGAGGATLAATVSAVNGTNAKATSNPAMRHGSVAETDYTPTLGDFFLKCEGLNGKQTFITAERATDRRLTVSCYGVKVGSSSIPAVVWFGAKP